MAAVLTLTATILILLQAASSTVSGATFEYQFGPGAERRPGPPARVGDTIVIRYPPTVNVWQLSNIGAFLTCHFRAPRLQGRARRTDTRWPKLLGRVGGGSVTWRPTAPGYIYLASNLTGTGCSREGARAILYIAPTVNPSWQNPKFANQRNYKFVLSERSVSADCVVKPNVPVVNGQYPGPPIHVRTGDIVRVTVVNMLKEDAAIHWHGIHHKGSQWQDGNNLGAQCPIPPGGSYTYVFNTTGQAGTKWWHGHIGFLRSSVYGAFVIYGRDEYDLLPKEILDERVVLLGDWHHRSNQQIQDGLDQKHGAFVDLGNPDTFTIGGSTRGNCSRYLRACGLRCLPCDSARCPATEVVRVRRFQTYRFRLINAGLYANANFHIQGHPFTIVEADGELLKPVTYRSLDILPGQTFSVLVHTGGERREYWMVSHGRFDNFGVPPGLAILRYRGAAPRQLGPVPAAPKETAGRTWSLEQTASFRSLFPVDLHLRGPQNEPTRRGLIRWGFHINDGFTRYSVNNISYLKPSMPVLYADKFDIPGIFDYKSFPSFAPAFPSGVTRLPPSRRGTSAFDVPWRSMVELILQNHIPPGLQHPWHLHGYTFYVVGSGMGEYDRSRQRLYEQGYNLVDPQPRNTITVYNNQWVAIRFRADNPGMWNLHCHLESHMYLGMQTFLRVHGPLPDPPPNYIRSCMNRKRADTMRSSPRPVTPKSPLPSPRPPSSPAPATAGPGRVTGAADIDWAQGKDSNVKIAVGGTVTFHFSAGNHALIALFGPPSDPDTFARTQRLLRSQPDQTGISDFVGGPPDPFGTWADTNAAVFLTPLETFAKTIRFPEAGLYLFSCPVHWSSMFAFVTVG